MCADTYLLYESSGGNQVDGLPPATSDRRVLGAAGRMMDAPAFCAVAKDDTISSSAGSDGRWGGVGAERCPGFGPRRYRLVGHLPPFWPATIYDKKLCELRFLDFPEFL